MQFYLANFEDLVDPNYDFVTEKNGPRRNEIGRYEHDAYAHEFFTEPIFDGMLLSKAVIRPVVERELRRVGDVHTFCRLDRTIPIMGDCGAFTYVNAEVPPFSVADILKYYEQFSFTYGVSIDHVVFGSMDTIERNRRVALTVDNARAFWSQHQAQGCTFTPVGIIQGWDPNSRRHVLTQLIEMGYTNFALGGMVRSTDKEILATLEALHSVLPLGTRLHLFGIARLPLLPDLMRYGATSVDTAAPIRRAFLGTGEDNYWLADGRRYAAIRIPEVKQGSAKKRGIASAEEVMESSGNNLDTLLAMEHQALFMLRAYDRGEVGLEETLQTVVTYDQLHGDQRNHVAAYRRTLSDRPWRQCTCPICRQAGVEVIIFRGNNRNRRRGFHNAKVFYDQFRAVVARYSQAAFEHHYQEPMTQATLDLPM
jgi:hypothetical protein